MACFWKIGRSFCRMEAVSAIFSARIYWMPRRASWVVFRFLLGLRYLGICCRSCSKGVSCSQKSCARGSSPCSLAMVARVRFLGL